MHLLGEWRSGCSDAQSGLVNKYAHLTSLSLSFNGSTNDLVGLSAAIPPLFNHFGKLKNSKYYSLEHAAQLMETVETAFTNQLTTILTTRPIMALDFQTFEGVLAGAKSAIDSWETGYNKFREFFEARCRKQSRILSQRLNGSEILGRLTMSHAPLAARLSEVGVNC